MGWAEDTPSMKRWDAQRIAIDSYRDMIEYLKEFDPTTRRLLEEILAKEEEHAEDLVSLLK